MRRPIRRIWRLIADHARLAPGSPIPSTQPDPLAALDTGSGRSAPERTTGSPADTRRPAGLAPAVSRLTFQGLGPGGKKSVVWYAEKYWNDGNRAYRKYGQDRTNFVSQAMRQGGWRFTGSGFWGREDQSTWYYGSHSFTTSHTWAAAEHWGVFARDRSRRTSALRNVWYLEPGDVLQADLDASGGKDHSMIVVGRDRRGERYLNYHTANSLHRRLSYILRLYPHPLVRPPDVTEQNEGRSC